jgi:hypothetical protein
MSREYMVVLLHGARSTFGWRLFPGVYGFLDVLFLIGRNF